MGRSVVLASILLALSGSIAAADAQRDFKDVVYATVDGKPLCTAWTTRPGPFFKGDPVERVVAFLKRSIG